MEQSGAKGGSSEPKTKKTKTIGQGHKKTKIKPIKPKDKRLRDRNKEEKRQKYKKKKYKKT